MKKAYIITATALLGIPLILAAAIKSVLPIIFWFLPVAGYLLITHGKSAGKGEKARKNSATKNATPNDKEKIKEKTPEESHGQTLKY